jgi:hypothetical protein
LLFFFFSFFIDKLINFYFLIISFFLSKNLFIINFKKRKKILIKII